MKLPEDIRQQLIRTFKKNHRQWLAPDLFPFAWPLPVSLAMPTEQTAKLQPEAVRTWIAAWQNWHGAGTVVWNERQWRSLGIQRLPEKLILHNPFEVALWVGESPRWQLAIERYTKIVAHWPQLSTATLNYFNVLADYPDTDFLRLMNMLEWIIAHPQSNLYPRQLPIAGIDTKWLESRKGLLAEWVAAIKKVPRREGDFYQHCGLRAPPYLIRFRLLDAKLRAMLGGLADITAPWEEVAALTIPIQQVFIVENLQTGLAFPDMPGAIVIMALGYSIDILPRLPWLTAARCWYWGDIDTHGFAILNRARTYLPHLQSVLMDKTTLFMHKALWVAEEKPHAAELLPKLLTAEQALYQAIKQQQWGQNIRLEQERIAWSIAMQALAFLI